MNKCGQCALKAIKGGMCPIFNANMEGKDGCPMFTDELRICELCGSIIPKGGHIIEENDIFHLICSNCATSSPCSHCDRTNVCRFQTDQSCPEPPYIMAQHRQGNAIIQTQQLNLKRVEATCAQNCPCYRPEGLEDGDYCLKQLGCGCRNHRYNWRNK